MKTINKVFLLAIILVIGFAVNKSEGISAAEPVKKLQKAVPTVALQAPAKLALTTRVYGIVDVQLPENFKVKGVSVSLSSKKAALDPSRFVIAMLNAVNGGYIYDLGNVKRGIFNVTAMAELINTTTNKTCMALAATEDSIDSAYNEGDSGNYMINVKIDESSIGECW